MKRKKVQPILMWLCSPMNKILLPSLSSFNLLLIIFKQVFIILSFHSSLLYSFFIIIIIGNKIVNSMEQDICSGIVSLLLSKIAYHPSKVAAGNTFSILSFLFNSSSLPGAFISRSSSSSFYSPASFWTEQLSPSLFYSVWKNYGFNFIGRAIPIDDTTSTSTSTTSSTSSNNEDNIKKEENGQSDNQLIFPIFNFTLVLQVLQQCTEIRYCFISLF